MNRSSTGTRIATAVAASLALIALAASPAIADTADSGHWALTQTRDAEALAGAIAVDPSAATVQFATFVAAQPGHVHTMTLDGSSVLDTVPVGLAPQYTQASVNSTTHRLYVSEFGSSAVSVVDTATGHLVDTITGTQWMPWSATVDTTRNLVYVVDGNDNQWHATGSVTVIDGTTNSVVATIDAPDDSSFAALSEKHGKLYVPAEGQSSISVLDTQTNTMLAPIAQTAAAAPLMAVADDALDRVWVLQIDPSTNAASILVIDSASDTVVGDPIALDAGYSVADAAMTYDPTSQKLVVAEYGPSGATSNLVTIDATTGSIIARDIVTPRAEGGDFTIFQLAIDPTTATLYATTSDNRILTFAWQASLDSEAAATLPATGGEPELSTGLIAAGLLVAGVALFVVRRRMSVTAA